jgi:DNA-binding transcriptional ArsR family regulator
MASSALTPEHARLILAIEKGLEEDGGSALAEALIALFQTRLGEEGKQILEEVRRKVDPILEVQRTMGEVEGILGVVSRAERISRAYFEAGQAELSEAFKRFGEKLIVVARRRGQPVIERAEGMRTENARKN